MSLPSALPLPARAPARLALLLAAAVGALACRPGAAPKPGGAGGADSAADTGDRADTAADTGGGDPGALDDAAFTALLVGTWQPVSMNDSGTEQPLPDDPATYLLLDGAAGVAFGCGAAPFGTWAATAGGPAPAIGVIEVAFGETRLTWPVLALDDTGFTFAEGGDTFTHVRGACP